MALSPHIPRSVRLGLAVPIVVVCLPLLVGVGWLLGGPLLAAGLPLLAVVLLVMVDVARVAAGRRAAFAAVQTLASAARRGVPLDRACFAAGAGGPGSMGGRAGRAMSDLGAAILQGDSLAAGLDRHLPLLPEGDRRAVAVAEARGNLAETLGRLAALRRCGVSGPGFRAVGPPPLRLAAVNAAVLSIALLAATVVFSVFVLPQLVDTSDHYQTPLPLLTRVLVLDGELSGFSDATLAGFALTLLAVITFSACTLVVARVLPGGVGRGNAVSDALVWAWPPTRHRAWSAAMATLGGSLSAGLDLPAALGDAAAASGSRVARRRLTRAASAAERDPSVPLPGLPRLARSLLFSPPGPRPATACLLAEAYDERAEASSARLTAVALPLAVMLAAVPVTLLCLALFLPLVQLIESLVLEVFA